MRVLILIYIILSIVSCNSIKNSNKPINQIKTEVSTVQEEREIESFVMYNGVITDTIYVEELTEKIMVKNYKVLDGELFICYSKYMVEEPLKNDLSFYFKDNYIVRASDFSLIEKLNKLIDIENVDVDKSILIGSPCSHDDIVQFDKITTKKLLYIAVPICSDYYYHQVFSRKDSTFILDFEFESSDSWLDFTLINDTILTTNYTLLNENDIEIIDFEYIFKE